MGRKATEDKPRRRINTPAVLAVLGAVLLLGVGGWLGVRLSVEGTALARARGFLAGGHSEAALDAMAPFRRGIPFARDYREAAAEIFFRLGEDYSGHRMLGTQKYDARDPRDHKLHELAVRCQQAAALLHRADLAHDPQERLALTRSAREQTPEAPAVLQRLVDEELAMMAHTSAAGAEKAFEEDYTELRVRAPKRAEAVKSRVAKALALETQ